MKLMKISLPVDTRRNLLISTFAFIAFVGSLLVPWWRSAPGSMIQTQPAPVTAPDLSRLNLLFEPNAGQSDPDVRFLAHTSGGTLYFTDSEVVLELPVTDSADNKANTDGTIVAGLNFIGTTPSVQIKSDGPLPGKVNYLVGNDPARWTTGLSTFSKITYTGIYPGINLTYEGDARQLKGTYTVAPGGDASLIRWRYTGVSNIRVDESGNLNMSLGEGQNALIEQAPVAWQEIGGQRVPVSASYALNASGEVRFALGSYDPALPLIIDPSITYSTYLGGNFAENGFGIAVDGSGNFYVTGYTNSSNFPRVNALQNSYGGVLDGFVAKFNPAGQPLYITYLGGSNVDTGNDIATDAAGNAYITGYTSSTNFPTANAYQPAHGGGTYDAFITKLNPTGSALIFSTYLGGSGYENSAGSGPSSGSITVDSDGNIYVDGYTTSSNFPVQNAIQPTRAGIDDLFITKFNPAGSSLIWSTYLGGTSNDQAKSIAIDPARNVYVTGFTNSDNYPTLLAYQPLRAGTTDAIVTKINAAGTALVYSTYLGGGIGEEGYDIAADSVGNAYVTGSTDSNTFPVWNAYQPSYGGLNDAFFAKFGPTGTIGFASYLGGTWPDVGMAVAVNGAGEMYLYGSTQSETFPTAHPIFPTLRGSEDAFITRFNAAGNTIIFSTFFGGSDNRELQTSGAMTLDAAGNIYFTGSTESSDYPTTANAYQPFRASPVDAFVSRISESDPTPTPNPPSPTPVICVLGNYSITQSTGATIVPGTTLVPNSACNDCTAPILLPFPVQFYDQTFTQARASSNGNLQFTSDNSLPFNSCLPNPQYNNTIFGYWDDLFLDCNAGWGCGIYTSTSGSAPNRIFNVEWRAHRNEPPIVNVKFEIRLYENGNGRFDIIYGQLDNPGNTASVGVQRDTGSRSTQFSCDTGVLTQGLQLTFTLPPCATATPAVNSPTPTLSPTATPTAPTLLYSTYYGSFERDSIEDIARDAAGNIYVMGTTFQSDINYGDIYVSKFSPNGQSVLYQTILGGTRIDYGYALSVDAAGNATVAGIATSNDYPLLNPIQATHGGGIYDVVLTKLNPTGNTIFSTYLGGNGTDYAGRLATDGAGNVFLTGYTSSTNFPVTAGAYQTTNHGNSDGFVTKISPNGSAIVWSTYLGGIYAEQSNDITLDGAGNIYLTGFTGSPDFPTVNPFQAALFDGDAFVTKMNPSGTALIFSTFLGGDNPPGPGEDSGQGIALDEQGYIYVTGFTQSPNFPTTPGSFQPFFNGYYDAFVTKFMPSGNALVYSTFIGGALDPPSGDDEAFDIAVDGAGQAHITGRTNSPDFPSVRAVQPVKQDVNEAFVTKLNASGSDLIYSTFLGGDYAPPYFTGDDSGSAILIDPAGNAVIGGGTASGNFPVANAYQPTSAGESDGFISKISGSNPLSSPTPTTTVLPTATFIPTTVPSTTAISTPQLTPQATGSATSVLPSSTPRPPTQTPGGPTATTEPTSVASVTPTVCAISFTDVPSDSTFYTWIRCLACRGIISGYTDGTFKPGNDITRGQIAKVVSNSAGFSEDAGPQIYEDVPVGSPFYDWINRLSMRGHMGGYLCGVVPEEPCIAPDNRPYFRPNASATRGQLAKIVANAAGLGGDPTGLFYTDVPEDHTFYVWIMRLTQLGVMGGYPCGGESEPCDDQNRPYFRPFANVTRGQASKIVANTFFPNCQTGLGR